MAPHFSIITPTILRPSLLEACASIDRQTCKSWHHIVMVDSEISDCTLANIQHPQRQIFRCERPHGNWGHSCVHRAWGMATGEYIYRLDDDNVLADDRVLEDLLKVVAEWAIFPILRCGAHFFFDPPGKYRTDSGSILVKRTAARWPDLPNYETDGIFVEHLLTNYPKYESFPEMRPIMVMPHSQSVSEVEVVAEKLSVSVFTPVHDITYLRDAYDSLAAQTDPDWIWCVVYNNGGVPIDFGDPRVKSHVLYKAPEKVGALKAYACEQATGDILLELDCDDLLLPNAIEEVKQAFADPAVSFAYSNCIHAMADLSKFPRYDESYGWKYREVEYAGRKLDEFVSFPPTPEAVSRIWYGPDHFRAFRRSSYRAAGGHDRSMRVLDDSDLVCRMYLEGKFAHIDKPLYLYRVHGQNSWLRYNAEIQQGVYGVYDRYIENLVKKWAERSNLPIVEVERYGDLKSRADSSAGLIKATDSFAKFHDPLETMKQVYRVLVPGGWLLCQVPSTDGRGAYQDPRNVSFWNENSFLYYTDARWAQYIGTPVRFQATRLYTTEPNAQKVCWTVAHLVSLKNGYRPCGEIRI